MKSAKCVDLLASDVAAQAAGLALAARAASWPSSRPQDALRLLAQSLLQLRYEAVRCTLPAHMRHSLIARTTREHCTRAHMLTQTCVVC